MKQKIGDQRSIPPPPPPLYKGGTLVMMGSFWCPTQQQTELADLSFVKSDKKFARKGIGKNKNKKLRPPVGCMP